MSLNNTNQTFTMIVSEENTFTLQTVSTMCQRDLLTCNTWCMKLEKISGDDSKLSNSIIMISH